MPSFFRTPNHRVFDIKPRYYDPIKERHGKEENKEKASQDPTEQAKARIRHHFGSKKKNLDMAGSKQTLFRVSLIAVFISLMIFWLFS